MSEDNLYVPEFLNTREKWNECVRIQTVLKNLNKL